MESVDGTDIVINTQKAILSNHFLHFTCDPDPAHPAFVSYSNPYYVKDLMPSILASSPIKPAWFMSLKVTAHLLCHGFRTGIKSDALGEREATMHIFNDFTRNEHGSKSDIAHLLTITTEELVLILEKQKSRSIESRKIEELAQLLMLISWKLDALTVMQVMNVHQLREETRQSEPEADAADIITHFRQDLVNLAGRLMLSAFAPMALMIEGVYKFSIQYTSGLVYGFKVGSGDFPWIESFVYNFRMVATTLWVLGGGKPTLKLEDFEYPMPSSFDLESLVMNRSLGKQLENADHCEICGKNFSAKSVVYPIEYGLSRISCFYPREFLYISRAKSSWGSPLDMLNSNRSVIIACGQSCLIDACKMFSPALAKFWDTLDETCSVKDDDSKNRRVKALCQDLLGIQSQEIKDLTFCSAQLRHDFGKKLVLTHRELRGFTTVWLLDNVDLNIPTITYKSNEQCLYLIDTPSFSISSNEVQVIVKDIVNENSKQLVKNVRSGAIPPNSPIGRYRSTVLQDIQQTPKEKLETVAEISLVWFNNPKLAPNFKFGSENLHIPVKIRICPKFKAQPFFTVVKVCFGLTSVVIFPAPNKCFQYPIYEEGCKFEVKPKTSRGLEELERIFMDNDCLIMTSGIDLVNKTVVGGFLYKDGNFFIGFFLTNMFNFLMGSSTFHEVCSSYLKVHSNIEVEELLKDQTEFEKNAERRPGKDAQIEAVLKAARMATINFTLLHKTPEPKQRIFLSDMQKCASVFFHISLKTEVDEDCDVVVRLGILNKCPGKFVEQQFRHIIGCFDTDLKVSYLPLPGKPTPPRFNSDEPLCYPTGTNNMEFHVKIDCPKMWEGWGYIDNVKTFDGYFEVVRVRIDLKDEQWRSETDNFFFLVAKDKPFRQWARHLLIENEIEKFLPRTIFLNTSEYHKNNIFTEPLLVDESKSISEIEESLGQDVSQRLFLLVFQNTFKFLDKVFDRKWFAPEANFASSYNRVVWYGTLELGDMFFRPPCETQLWLIGNQSLSESEVVIRSCQTLRILPISNDQSKRMTVVASFRAIIAPVWPGKRFVDLTQDVVLRIARSDVELRMKVSTLNKKKLLLILRYDPKLKSFFVNVLRKVAKTKESDLRDSFAQTRAKTRQPCLFTSIKGIFLSEPVFLLVRETQPQDEEFAKYTQILNSSPVLVLNVMIPLNESLAERAKAICLPFKTENVAPECVRIDLKPMKNPLSLSHVIIGMDSNVNDSKENPILREDLYLVEVINEVQLALILTPIAIRRQLSQFCLDEKLTLVSKSALKPAPVVENERIIWISNLETPLVISHQGLCPSLNESTLNAFFFRVMGRHPLFRIEKPTDTDSTARVIDPDDLVRFDVRFLRKIEPFSQVDSLLTCLLTMKELSLIVNDVPLSLRYYREERVPLKMEISIQRVLKQVQNDTFVPRSLSFTDITLVGNVSIGYQKKAVWEFLITSSKTSLSVDCFKNDEVSPNSEDPTHELITSWTNPKVLKKMVKKSKSTMCPIQLHLTRQTHDPILSYFTSELESVAQTPELFPLLVIPRRTDFLTQNSSYSGSNHKLGGFLLEFDFIESIFTGKFFPRQDIIQMICKGGAKIHQSGTSNIETTDSRCSDLEGKKQDLQESTKSTEKPIQEHQEELQTEEAKTQFIKSVHDLIQACSAQGPKLSTKKSLTRSQVTRIAPNIDVEKVLEYVGGLQSLSYHVKVRQDELKDNDLNKTINLPSLRVNTGDKEKTHELLDQMVEKVCSSMSESLTFELSRCAFCRREDFEFPVCQTCRVTKYCNEQCFNTDKFTHMKECVDRSKSLGLETLSDSKKIFPQI